MKNVNFIGICTVLSASVIGLSACHKNIKTETPAAETQTAQTDTQKEQPIEVTEGEIQQPAEADIRGSSEFYASEKLKPVPFKYDKYELSEDARTVIMDNAGFLNSNKDLKIMVEGYCDERGTTEYNLALGQKRAKSVRDYYIRLGVNPESVGTISYGEEKPLCQEQTEECWTKNRRAETKVK